MSDLVGTESAKGGVPKKPVSAPLRSWVIAYRAPSWDETHSEVAVRTWKAAGPIIGGLLLLSSLLTTPSGGFATVCIAVAAVLRGVVQFFPLSSIRKRAHVGLLILAAVVLLVLPWVLRSTVDAKAPQGWYDANWLAVLGALVLIGAPAVADYVELRLRSKYPVLKIPISDEDQKLLNKFNSIPAARTAEYEFPKAQLQKLIEAHDENLKSMRSPSFPAESYDAKDSHRSERVFE